MRSGKFPINIVSEHNLSCHPQMPVKSLSFKEWYVWCIGTRSRSSDVFSSLLVIKQRIQHRRLRTVKQQESYIRQEWITTSLTQNSSNWSFHSREVYILLWKEEGMLHTGKHGPIPIFSRRAAAMKFKMILFVIGVVQWRKSNKATYHFDLLECGEMVILGKLLHTHTHCEDNLVPVRF